MRGSAPQNTGNHRPVTDRTRITADMDAYDDAPEAAPVPAGAAAEAQREAAPGPKADASGDAPLCSTQSNCCPSADEADRRRVRWAARAVLWQASPLYAVRTCGRHLAPEIDRSGGGSVPRSSADVKRREMAGSDTPRRAGYTGLTLCGSVWACPRCSAVVAAARSREIGSAVRRCDELGGQVQFLTLTLRHVRSDALADLFDPLAAGWRAAVLCQ